MEVALNQAQLLGFSLDSQLTKLMLVAVVPTLAELELSYLVNPEEPVLVLTSLLEVLIKLRQHGYHASRYACCLRR